jgi:EAL domain-containing protein (putative c-di-GMP-specific phosphodiesterase class I)
MRRLANERCAAKIAIMSGADPKTLAAASRLGREYGLDMAPTFAKPFAPEALARFLEAAKIGLRQIAPGELVAALSTGQLEVRYQPKVTLQGAAPGIVGAEALVRWNHPRRGLLTANRFISMAEAEGLIESLSSWVLAEVISQQAIWERQGKHLVIAVNLPASLLGDLDFPDRVEAMLHHAGIPRNRLILEITERAAMKDGPTAIDVLTRFRLKDISLSIDDFGVGHSSLVELYRMPFNELKIDASFVRDMPASEEATTIVRTLVTLAHELGLKACAEGVETVATAEMLRSFGCDTAQGFLYGSALTVAEFEGLLADQERSHRPGSGSPATRIGKVDDHERNINSDACELAG